ncbi:MAG: transcription termination/antitermination NusG family protein [Bacteroidota bacterium]|jgi:transcriptional antiterminator RfaH
MDWYIISTKAKWEKKVAQELNNLGVHCYCPLITQVRQWSDRKKKTAVPLFNCCIFVQFPKETDRNIVFESSGVVRFLFWLGRPAKLHNDEINLIKEWLNDIQDKDARSTQFQIGDRKKLDSDLCKIKELISTKD